MNKVIITMICVIVILIAVFTAIIIAKPDDNGNVQVEITKVADEQIFDECTDEYDELQKSEIRETNASEEKISPYCSFTLKKHYITCNHTINEYKDLPQALVNKTKEDLQKIYEDWNIESFSSNEIILSKECEGECGEHFIVKDEDGKVVIYRIKEDGEEELYEKTEISTEYVTQTDKIRMKDGVKVNGKEELNQFIEDFE